MSVACAPFAFAALLTGCQLWDGGAGNEEVRRGPIAETAEVVRGPEARRSPAGSAPSSTESRFDPESGAEPDGPSQVEDTTFSHDRGLFEAPFDLTIASETPGAHIRYTLDGRDPSTSDTARSGPSPVTVRIDPATTDGRAAAPAVVVRAMARRDGMEPTNVDTQTYVFPDAVLDQPAELGADWPVFDYGGPGGPSRHDYEMDPAVVGEVRDAAEAGLAGVPTLSVVMPPEEFWTMYRGTSEHAASFELIWPEGGGEQVDGGIESHSHDRAKRSMRMVFKEVWGATEWETDLFARAPLHGEDASTTQERIVLRGGNNRSWARTWRPDRTAHTVDQWYRDTQIAMSGYGSRGTFAHLYINGIYWGLYNPVERPDHHLAALYFGGRSDDWLAVNHDGPRSGDAIRWESLVAAAESGDGVPGEVAEALDLPAFADYLLVSWFIGIRDWPGNNWWATARLEPPGPFRFYAWDGEWSFGSGFESPERPEVNPDFRPGGPYFDTEAPVAKIFHAAVEDPRFRMVLADRAFRHLHEGGALTDRENRERWRTLNDWVRDAVVAESARWGDAVIDGPTRRRDPDWVREVETIDDYLDGGAAEFREALIDAGYYPARDGRAFQPPRVLRDGRPVEGAGIVLEPGGELTIAPPEGASDGASRLSYRTDGTDPFQDPADGGQYEADGSGTAVIGSDGGSYVLRARRVLRQSGPPLWSPLRELTVWLAQDRSGLQISEIMYHPADGGAEFIELHNAGEDPFDLGGVRFGDGIRYAFPVGRQLAPGERVVLASDAAAFEGWTGRAADGTYDGRLDNGGERLSLLDVDGAELAVVEYDDSDPWPESADGEGRSLVLRPDLAPGTGPTRYDRAAAWTASERVGGTPGEAP